MKVTRSQKKRILRVIILAGEETHQPTTNNGGCSTWAANQIWPCRFQPESIEMSQSLALLSLTFWPSRWLLATSSIDHCALSRARGWNKTWDSFGMIWDKLSRLFDESLYRTWLYCSKALRWLFMGYPQDWAVVGESWWQAQNLHRSDRRHDSFFVHYKHTT